VSCIVFDSGALIALERNDRNLWSALKVAALSSADILVPSTVLAQVWRGSPGQALLSRALDFCEVAPFDPVAREVGKLCGKTHTSDICDAHVAIIASRQGAILYTGDPRDLRRLLAALGRRSPRIIAC
jgi:predicted nucleic acid-binding protein